MDLNQGDVPPRLQSVELVNQSNYFRLTHGTPQKKGPESKKAFLSGPDSSREVGEYPERVAERGISGDSTASLAYLHSVVTVIIGSFVSSAEARTRKTLSAGVAKHVRERGGGGVCCYYSLWVSYV